jgi:hypothetical protein
MKLSKGSNKMILFVLLFRFLDICNVSISKILVRIFENMIVNKDKSDSNYERKLECKTSIIDIIIQVKLDFHIL